MARLVVPVLALATLAGCVAAGSAPPDPPAETAPTGHRVRIEVPLPGGSMVTEVLSGADGEHARAWSDSADGPQPLLEEIRIGTDHWVQLPALVREGILEPGWIHLDLSDPVERRWQEANSLGLVEQAALWSARPGDPYADDRIASVDQRAPGERVLHLASGMEIHVTREALQAAPGIAPPDPATVVPFRDIERLLAGSGPSTTP